MEDLIDEPATDQPPAPIGMITVTNEGERQIMAQKYRFNNLPNKADQPDQDAVKDVVAYQIQLFENGTPRAAERVDDLTQLVWPAPGDDPVLIEDGIEFFVEHRWIDDANLAGAALRSAATIAADTTAPPAPVGDIGVTNEGET